ncbi:MAG: SpoIIE family protein phosphatase [Bdellovibrionales bacterium]|nr:SpoIIE family protein phosphatase [Bdellovibrionales bacterium]
MKPDSTTPIRITVAGKILLALIAIVLVSIGFLGFTASRLFVSDKEVSVFDNQVSEASFSAREINGRLKGAMDVLRSVAASAKIPGTNLEQVFQNQSVLEGFELFEVTAEDPKPKAVNPPIKVGKGFDAEPDLLPWMAELKTKRYLFRNVTKDPKEPRLMVLLLGEGSPEPLLVGFVSMKTFFDSLSAGTNRFSIVDSQGYALMDSDVTQILGSNQATFSQDPVFLSAKQSVLPNGSKKVTGDKEYLSSFSKTDLGIYVLVRAEYRKVVQAMYSLVEKIVLFGMGLMSVLILAGTFLIRRITSPIRDLFRATHQISEGQFDIEIAVESKDEIGALARSFDFMSQKIKALIQDLVEKSRLDQELKIAQAVQGKLLPREFISTAQSQVASFYRSASECGGDWWGIAEFPGKTVFAIADATGHGVSSALITAAARSSFSMFEKFATEQPDQISPKRVLELANRAIFDSAQGDIMMTYFACVVDHQAKKIFASSAGHNPQYFVSLSGGGAIKGLTPRGNRLGESRNLDASTWEMIGLSYQPGDRLFLYTDGLIEAMNAELKQFGRKGLRNVLTSASRADVGAGIQQVTQAVFDHTGPRPLDDDITLVMAELH